MLGRQIVDKAKVKTLADVRRRYTAIVESTEGPKDRKLKQQSSDMSVRGRFLESKLMRVWRTLSGENINHLQGELGEGIRPSLPFASLLLIRKERSNTCISIGGFSLRRP